MPPPSVAVSIWILAAFDPILVGVAATLGWKADQFGKVFIAVIAALGASVLGGWLITALGLPWVAPVGRDAPLLLPVRTIASLLWAMSAYALRRTRRG